MFLKILALSILITNCIVCGAEETAKTGNCKELNDKFIKTSHHFVKCVLDHNENATFCEDCIEQYANVTVAFNDLMIQNETDHKAKQGPCRSHYIDANQLDLVETYFGHTKRLWEIGDCSDCFNSTCDLLNFTNATCPRSNRTLEFEKLLNATTDCFNSTGDQLNITCKNCTEQYVNLTNYYNSIRLKTSDKFCFSIKYKMNKTQQHWANELHCCEERKSSLEDFSFLSSFSVTLLIAFYIFTFIMGKRKERVQDIPDDLMPPPPQEPDESADTVMNINSDDPATSASANGSSHSKILNSEHNALDGVGDDDDDTDDDNDADILPIQNTNLIEIGE